MKLLIGSICQQLFKSCYQLSMLDYQAFSIAGLSTSWNSLPGDPTCSFDSFWHDRKLFSFLWLLAYTAYYKLCNYVLQKSIIDPELALILTIFYGSCPFWCQPEEILSWIFITQWITSFFHSLTHSGKKQLKTKSIKRYDMIRYYNDIFVAVSYTHLTLPTILRV